MNNFHRKKHFHKKSFTKIAIFTKKIEANFLSSPVLINRLRKKNKPYVHFFLAVTTLLHMFYT